MAFSMAFSMAKFSSLSSPLFSPLPQPTSERAFLPRRQPSIRALSGSEPDNSPQKPAETKTESSSSAQPSASTPAATAVPKRPQKPVYSMKKGQIVRVDKEKYLSSVHYLSVDHPPYYKGLDYIYEDRGEVLDLRNFDTGEHALVAWVGIPTAPAWLPTDMLIKTMSRRSLRPQPPGSPPKSDKLDYERM